MYNAVKKEVTEKKVTFQCNKVLPSGTKINVVVEIMDTEKAVGYDTSQDINHAIKHAVNSIKDYSKNWAVIDE
ncbi:hypothetical protein BEP19_15805 [Ammoniphilus oxalaticus]|uniref:Uncharacterized protein n=1 Tax=Ammoniphilus oxalaticus TaxID=66863 RepID=A0A419SDG6_9BACL|nr:hypothetical protein [Ammoniphilus oxalaticus]RKD21135.1 hypothetical protein BEP19_15805 [Ammoniphilus oxalaticus]